MTERSGGVRTGEFFQYSTPTDCADYSSTQEEKKDVKEERRELKKNDG